MRTTVEIKPEHRAALLSLAAQRGQKGFSDVLSEAIDLYLCSEEQESNRRASLLELAGTISSECGDELRAAAADVRKSWR